MELAYVFLMEHRLMLEFRDINGLSWRGHGVKYTINCNGSVGMLSPFICGFQDDMCHVS